MVSGKAIGPFSWVRGQSMASDVLLCGFPPYLALRGSLTKSKAGCLHLGWLYPLTPAPLENIFLSRILTVRLRHGHNCYPHLFKIKK